MKTLKLFMWYLAVFAVFEAWMYLQGDLLTVPLIVGGGVISAILMIPIWAIRAVVIATLLWMRGDSKKAAPQPVAEVAPAPAVSAASQPKPKGKGRWWLSRKPAVVQPSQDVSPQPVAEVAPAPAVSAASQPKPKGWLLGRVRYFSELYLICLAGLVVMAKGLSSGEALVLFVVLVVLWFIGELVFLMLRRFVIPLFLGNEEGVKARQNIADKVAKAKDVTIGRLPEQVKHPVRSFKASKQKKADAERAAQVAKAVGSLTEAMAVPELASGVRSLVQGAVDLPGAMKVKVLNAIWLLPKADLEEFLASQSQQVADAVDPDPLADMDFSGNDAASVGTYDPLNIEAASEPVTDGQLDALDIPLFLRSKDGGDDVPKVVVDVRGRDGGIARHVSSD